MPSPSPDAPACPFPMRSESRESVPSTSAAPPAATEEAACFWALLSTSAESDMLHFVYVDPAVQQRLGPAATSLTRRAFTDFVHPDERAHARDDLARIVQSRTLFGSVTRCRYASLDQMQRMLTADEAPGDFRATDVVANMVGERLALCFFHTVSNTPAGATHCGDARQAFDAVQSRQIWQQLYHATGPPSDAAVHYVFQVLANGPQREILFSWPPPRTERSGAEDYASYHAQDFARLVQGIHAGQAAQGAQPTSCTQRFRASHTLTASGRMRGIASVLIPYGAVVLACFQVTSDAPSPERASPVAKRQRTQSVEAPLAAKPEGPAEGWKKETHASIPLDAGTAHAVRSSLLQGGLPTQHTEMDTSSNVATLAAVAAAAAAQSKTCSSCGKSNSPEWRRGPSGHKTVRRLTDPVVQCMWPALRALAVQQAQALQGRHGRHRRGDGRPRHGPPQPRQRWWLAPWRAPPDPEAQRDAGRCARSAVAERAPRERSCEPAARVGAARCADDAPRAVCPVGRPPAALGRDGGGGGGGGG